MFLIAPTYCTQTNLFVNKNIEEQSSVRVYVKYLNVHVIYTISNKLPDTRLTSVSNCNLLNAIDMSFGGQNILNVQILQQNKNNQRVRISLSNLH